MRDGDKQRFRGRSVFDAIRNVRKEISDAVVGLDAYDQRGLDETMIALDGTENKQRLGANAILAVSMAAVDATARARNRPLFEHLGKGSGDLLPLPEIQIIGGGAHANWRTDIQDFLLIANGARSYAESLEITFNVFHAAGDIMKERGQSFGVADEGGYWPEFDSNEAAFDVVTDAIRRAGYTPGVEASISLDIAASDLFDEKEGRYVFRLEKRAFTRGQFVDLMLRWCEQYPILSIEDPAADTDWTSWQKIYAAVGDQIQLVGDDLFTTNLNRIRQGIERKCANSVLIKLNQIGTVSETLDAIRLTKDAGWLPVVSARSGETEDAFISHLAVGTNAGQLKVGSFCRSERMSKWNEVLRIERTLDHRARFLGAKIFENLRRS
jgi:enolase